MKTEILVFIAFLVMYLYGCRTHHSSDYERLQGMMPNTTKHITATGWCGWEEAYFPHLLIAKKCKEDQ